MAGRTAALAGATGFLGRRLAPALIARGWHVRALVRRSSDGHDLRRDGIDTVLGDLADPAALRDLAAGADIVVNCAGLIKARDRAAFFAVNRDGAANLAASCSGRVLLVSSLAAREPQLSHYAASKRAGEDAARAIGGDRLVVVRPPAIYGPGDRETLALFRVAGGWPVTPVPSNGRARLAIAHVDDVAEAILHVMDQPGLTGVYAVGGDRPAGYSLAEIMTEACRALGRAPRLIDIPAWAVRAAAATTECIGKLGSSPPIFTPGKARELLHADWSVGQSELAPHSPIARFTLKSGFADAIAWYRCAGWL